MKPGQRRPPKQERCTKKQSRGPKGAKQRRKVDDLIRIEDIFKKKERNNYDEEKEDSDFTEWILNGDDW